MKKTKFGIKLRFDSQIIPAGYKPALDEIECLIYTDPNVEGITVIELYKRELCPTEQHRSKQRELIMDAVETVHKELNVPMPQLNLK